MLKASKVFKNYGHDHTFTQGAFYMAIAIFVIIGLAFTAIAAHVALQYGYEPSSTFEVLILALGLPLLGIFINQKSGNWFISFIGYMLIVLPFGVVLGPALKGYDPDVIRNVALLTALITILMGTAGVLFPSFFSKIGWVLFISLCCLLVVRIIALFVPAMQHFHIIDYIAAGIFSLYIGWDMWRASQVERTMDNSVDIAAALYLDLINLFLSLLSSTDDD